MDIDDLQSNGDWYNEYYDEYNENYSFAAECHYPIKEPKPEVEMPEHHSNTLFDMANPVSVEYTDWQGRSIVSPQPSPDSESDSMTDDEVDIFMNTVQETEMEERVIVNPHISLRDDRV